MRARFLFPLIAVFSVVMGLSMADSRVRRVFVKGDQIVTVKTAMGVATIIQVPDKPNSVVVGDLNAYKVEYLDTAITIKPISSRAKSNLYIYTDYRRFNVQLQTGSEASSDYVVYLENPRSDPPVEAKTIKRPEVEWMKISSRMKNDELEITALRVGQNRHGLCFIDFTLTSTKSEKLDPAWFWLTQANASRPIQGLVLSSLNITKKIPVHGTIEILRSDVSDEEPLNIELRRKHTSTLKILKVSEWK